MAEHTWESKQAHYQRPDIVAGYDRRRFPSDKSTLRKWRIIRRMLDERTDVRTVLDMPCGTGRFTGRLQEHGMRVVAADLSLAMLQEARGRHPSPLEAVRGDAARLPLCDGAVDMVLCIRFMMHVPPEHRVAVMRELARVSRRWVLLDVRHLYSLGYWWKSLRHSAGLKVKTPVFRYTWRTLKADLAQAGLKIHKQAWLCPGFSEKLLILCEKSATGPADLGHEDSDRHSKTT